MRSAVVAGELGDGDGDVDGEGVDSTAVGVGAGAGVDDVGGSRCVTNATVAVTSAAPIVPMATQAP